MEWLPRSRGGNLPSGDLLHSIWECRAVWTEWALGTVLRYVTQDFQGEERMRKAMQEL